MTEKEIKLAAEAAASTILGRKPGFKPDIGLILGSGIGPLADYVEDAEVVSYADLPGFPKPGVAGHAGELVLGTIGGANVACLKGRVHMYEGHGAAPLKVMIRTLRALGTERLFVTCAAGSTTMDVGPGQLMMIDDHINFQGMNPLQGENDDATGPRFPGMDDAYDKSMRQQFKAAAEAEGIALASGTYMAFLGPCFETPAEIRMAKAMGADAVGMSTVPDCIIARHCGMKVIGCSVITNYAAGMFHDALSHDHTLEGAALAAENLQKLVLRFLKNLR